MPAIHSHAERLTVARQLHDADRCADAVELLQTYITNAGGSAEVDEAIFLLGDCYLKTHEWVLASTEFERLLRDYPESDSSAAASFGMGEALFGQSGKEDFDQEFTAKALDQWQSYLQAYPGHWRNAEAQHRVLAARTRLANKLVKTGTLYLKLKLAGPARVYFRKVADEYPETSAHAEALRGLALCDAAEGKRAEAIAQLKQLEEGYAGQPAAERAARDRRRLEHR